MTVMSRFNYDSLKLHLYLPSYLGKETAKGPCGRPVKLPPTHQSTTTVEALHGSFLIDANLYNN